MSKAGWNSFSLLTKEMPTEEPRLAGFTTQGKLKLEFGICSNDDFSIFIAGETFKPARHKICREAHLSIAKAEAATPEPV